MKDPPPHTHFNPGVLFLFLLLPGHRVPLQPPLPSPRLFHPALSPGRAPPASLPQPPRKSWAPSTPGVEGRGASPPGAAQGLVRYRATPGSSGLPLPSSCVSARDSPRLFSLGSASRSQPRRSHSPRIKSRRSGGRFSARHRFRRVRQRGTG